MIKLRKNADRKVRRGGLWIFSNEIEAPSVKELEPGDIHELVDFSGEFLGMVYANPNSLIAARLLSRKRGAIDSDFVMNRLKEALDRRQPFCREREAYRVFFGESDLLPGLIIDRYGPNLVIQSSTAGVDKILDTVVDVAMNLFSPKSIVLRNDLSVRNLEGIPLYKLLRSGSDVDRVGFRSDGLNFVADLLNGQKTGFFLDQEFNRSSLRKYIPDGSTLLDLYCYSGAWGLHGLAGGAGVVTCVDSSQPALELAMENTRLNKYESRVNFVREEVLRFLGTCPDQWDVIVLDPPAFIKSRSKVREGRQGYIDVNRKALSRLKQGGIFVTCSCSGHMELTDFLEVLNVSAHRCGKNLRLLEILGQGPDHPTLMAMPDTRYLKVIVAQAV